MIKNILIGTVIALGMTVCTSMADTMSKAAGLGVVSQEKSTFDNATIISVSPTFLYTKGSWGNSIKLGARWSSKSPEYVALILAYDSSITSSSTAYLSLTGIDINIDGEISSHSTGSPTNLDSSGYNSVSKNIYTSSQNTVVIPYTLLERMVSAKDCRLRIQTGKGYEDSEFSIERIPGGQGTAILSIKEFMAKVSATRG